LGSPAQEQKNKRPPTLVRQSNLRPLGHATKNKRGKGKFANSSATGGEKPLLAWGKQRSKKKKHKGRSKTNGRHGKVPTR